MQGQQGKIHTVQQLPVSTHRRLDHHDQHVSIGQEIVVMANQQSYSVPSFPAM